MVDLSSYGVEGTAALWVTEPGINQVSVKGDGGKLLFWDGEKIIPLKVSAGTNQLLLNAVADEWGLVLLDSFDADSVSTVTVDDIEWLGDSFSDIGRQDSTHYSLFSLGDTEADLVNGTFMVGTGTGDRAASTLSKEIIGDKQYLKPYGTEGSLVTLGGLDNGVYQFNLEQLGKIDTTNNDSMYAWNGKDLTLIADNESGFITNSVDVIYGYLTFISLDAVTKTGTTDFTISNLNRVDDLPYEAPIPISLIPDNYIGDVDLYENQTRISTGGGDRAVSTLTRELGIDLSGLGTEGSYGRWNVPNGIYEVTYYLYASENELVSDGLIMGDTIEFDVEAGEVELKLFMSEPATSVEYDLILQAISIPPEPDSTPSDLGVVGTGVNGNASGFIYQDEYIGIDDSIDIFTFNSTDATFEFTLWAGARSLGVSLSDDAGMVAQFLQAGGQQTYTWNLYGNDANYITGDHTLIIEDLTGDGGSGYYDFALWQGGDSSNASQQFPTNEPLLDPLTGYPAPPHTPIYSEPPDPIPDTGRDLGNTQETAWDMGILKPWETDSNTGITWNQGYVYGTYHLGHSYISEKIGGGDVTDWTTFTLQVSLSYFIAPFICLTQILTMQTR